ncbi:MAG: hypothetical protein ACJ763_06010 [Bdellovibrionia bacterium]
MGEWITLMDYAMKKGVSLSTLRRHIKADKIQYRVENGRYLLFVEQGDEILTSRPAAASTVAPVTAIATPAAASQSDDYLMSQLQTKLKKAQEEIAELKTLIAFYEESLGFAQSNPPATQPFANRFDG